MVLVSGVDIGLGPDLETSSSCELELSVEEAALFESLIVAGLVVFAGRSSFRSGTAMNAQGYFFRPVCRVYLSCTSW